MSNNVSTGGVIFDAHLTPTGGFTSHCNKWIKTLNYGVINDALLLRRLEVLHLLNGIKWLWSRPSVDYGAHILWRRDPTMPAKKDYHHNARFQLRLDQSTLDALKRKAERVGLPVNQLIVTILERECDDMGHYHAQMTAKHSYVSFALLNVLASLSIPAEVRKEVISTRPGPGGGIFLSAANGTVQDMKGALSTLNVKALVVGMTTFDGTNDKGKTVSGVSLHIGAVGVGVTKSVGNTTVGQAANNGPAPAPIGPCTGRSCTAPNANPPAVQCNQCTGRSCLAG